MFPSVGRTQLPKPRTHHDSSAVSACLKSTQPTEVLANPKGQYLRKLLRKSAKLRTPYYVPSDPIVDEAIKRKPTRPMKVLTGEIRLDRRREFVPRRVARPVIPEVESLAPDEDFLFKTSDSQMNVVPQKPKELFLMNQFIADTKNLRMSARTESGVQQKRPIETSSQETAEASPKKKRATTKKAISHSARNEVPAPASKHDPLPNIPYPIKLTFRLKPKSSPSDLPVEYTVAINSS